MFRRIRNEEGFTLIQLLATILIIGLGVIALSVFLNRDESPKEKPAATSGQMTKQSAKRCTEAQGKSDGYYGRKRNRKCASSAYAENFYAGRRDRKTCPERRGLKDGQSGKRMNDACAEKSVKYIEAYQKGINRYLDTQASKVRSRNRDEAKQRKRIQDAFECTMNATCFFEPKGNSQ